MANGLLDEPLARSLLAAAADEGLDLAGALGGLRRGAAPHRGRPAGDHSSSSWCWPPVCPADLDVVGVAGHSVGEYAAVSVAGAYTPEDAMRMVIRRGREMAAMNEGTMAAVIGLDVDAVSARCAPRSAPRGRWS